MTPLEIAIDELLVRGLSPSEASVAATALEARLSALAEQSPATLGERAEVSRKLSPVDVPSHSPAAVVARATAVAWNRRLYAHVAFARRNRRGLRCSMPVDPFGDLGLPRSLSRNGGHVASPSA